ncbi:MAG: hypothetical protein M1814_003062 [Vezdaea aestivalis]|nr:MAG: hypothetical protein M1814_003062 [Vezdaea aestivalis]
MRALVSRETGAVSSRSPTTSILSLDTFSALHSQTRELWMRLWLFPDLPNLVRSLLKSFDRSHWDWNATSLLDTILEIQTVYQEYIRSAAPTPNDPFEEGVLLSLSDVISIVDVFAADLIPYHTRNFESALNRELQFKVLGAALDLAKLLGANRFTNERYQTLRNKLKARHTDVLNGRDGGDSAIYSFGDGEVLIRHALDSLADTPSDVRAGVTLVKGFVNIVFAAGLVYTCNAPQALQCLQIFQELPDSPCRWYRPLQELRSWSLGAICLMRYSRVAPRGPRTENMNRLACSVVSELIRKFEPTLHTQFQKLLEQTVANNTRRVLRQPLRHVNIEVPMDHFHGILGILHLLENLATECGHLPYFDGPKAFCIRAISLCLDKPSFLMLRFKMLEVLLSIKYSRTENARFGSDELPKVKSDNATKQLRSEAEVSTARFVRKRQLQDQARASAVHQMDEVRGQLLPTMMGYGFYKPMSPESPQREATPFAPPRENRPNRMIRNLTSAIRSPPNPFRQPQRTETQPAEYVQRRITPVVAAPLRSTTAPMGPAQLTPPPTPHRRRHPEHIQTSPTIPTSRNSPMVHSPRVYDNRSPEPFMTSTALTEGMLRTLTRENNGPPRLHNSPTFPREGHGPPRLHESPASSVFDVTRSPHGTTPDFSSSNDGNVSQQGTSSPTSLYSPLPPSNSPSRSSPPMHNGYLSPEIRSPRPRGLSRSSNGNHSPMPRQMSRSSDGQHPSDWVEVQSQVTIDSMEEQKMEKVRLTSSKANYVAISPNGRFAAFVHKHTIQIAALSSASSRTGTIMNADKGETFKAVALTNEYIAAYSAKAILICKYGEDLKPQSPIRRHTLDDSIIPQCIAMSRDSSWIAIGERRTVNTPRAGHAITAAVQLYRNNLTPAQRLDCTDDQALELPKIISFNANGSTIMCSTTMKIFCWTLSSNTWQPVAVEPVRATGASSKGITSITPLHPWTRASTFFPEGIAPLGFPRQYYLTTTILSNIRNQFSTFISSISTRPPLKSHLASSEHFHRATVSTDSLLAAFLTDEGKIKLATISPREPLSNPRPSEAGGLALVELQNVPASVCLQRETHSEDAAQLRVHISDGGQVYTVTGVDRRGKVVRLSCRAIVESEEAGFAVPEMQPWAMSVTELPATPFKNGGRGGLYELPPQGHAESYFQPRELSAVPSVPTSRAGTR